MAEELSGVTVVIIIAGGFLTLILLFIFAKRQIMRFALKSRRGPHAPVGHGAKKAYRREIDRRLEVIPKICYEPKLIPDETNPSNVFPSKDKTSSSLYFRLKAVDDLKLLECEIMKYDKSLSRHPADNIRAFLLNALAAPMNGATGQRIVQQFCDLYQHARHDPNEFTFDDYQMYSKLLAKLMDSAKLLRNYGGISNRSSPNNTGKSGPGKIRESEDESVKNGETSL